MRTHREPAGPPARPTRRAVLAGGIGIALLGAGAAGYELVRDGTLPGKYTLARLDGACGSPPSRPPGTPPDRRSVAFHSAYRRREVTMVTLTPAGWRAAPAGAAGTTPAGGLGVVIVLHGAGGDAVSMASGVATAMTAAKITGVAAITVDGGDTYWHDRADGDDPTGMILHEVLPRAAAAGLLTSRIGIAGESMGGYGALLLAEQLGAAAAAGRTGGRGGLPVAAAVAALSPAVFASYDDAIAANKESFDSPADFARNSVQSGLGPLRRVPAWISVGTEDPFRPEASLLRTRLAALTGHEPAGGVLPGCHDDAFFDRNLPAALSFAAAHLG